MIGGPGVYVEIDETCVAKQKHNRGKRKPGSQRWIFGGTERGEGGRCFAHRILRRNKKWLYASIKANIAEGTTIISDEWPAYLRLEKNLPMYKHLLIRHKKDSGGSFAKSMLLPDGSKLRIHTNKCEGLWSHLKHKIKKIRGTSKSLLQSYISEGVFRMNIRASKSNIFQSFLCCMSEYYVK